MATKLRGVVVGASSLLGKELLEELNTSETSWDLSLADTGDSSGQLVAGGEEPLVVQPLSPGIFEGRNVAFFSGVPQTTRTHWREAKTAGDAIVDLTAALESEPGTIVRSPWVSGGRVPTADTVAVIPAHPAAVMLGIVTSRLAAAFDHVHLAATVLEPASQQGSTGLDEMHQQTVSLLGFHAMPQEIYDSQVAFNLRIGVGEAAKVDMGGIATTIRRHLKAIAGEPIASSVALQLVQAPVFHGYTMSAYVQLPANAEPAAVRRALHGGVVNLTNAEEQAPSNQSVVQESGIAIALTEDSSTHGTHNFWLWMAADNLKLAANHAVACAEEIAALRAGKPQP